MQCIARSAADSVIAGHTGRPGNDSPAKTFLVHGRTQPVQVQNQCADLIVTVDLPIAAGPASVHRAALLHSEVFRSCEPERLLATEAVVIGDGQEVISAIASH